MGRTLPAPVPCKVCGDRSYGKHYGVFCCDGCSCFFKRSVRRNIIYTCISGDARCIIDKARRNWCPYCRLQRCFKVRMNTAAVQEERGPRKQKVKENSISKSLTRTQNLSYNQTNNQSTKINTIRNLQLNCEHDLVAQILLITIKNIRCSSGFGLLNRRAQDEILIYLWGPLFILKAAYWPASVSSDVNLKNTFKKLKELNLDYMEIQIIENILLCRGDLIEDSRQAALANTIQERALQTLKNRTLVDQNRLLNLLLLLPMLFTPSPGALCALLFRPIIGPIPMETVILTI